MCWKFVSMSHSYHTIIVTGGGGYWERVEHGSIKGKVQRDFRPLVFHHSNLHGPLTTGLKYVRFWLRFHQFIPIFCNLPGVWYPGESIFLGYDTALSHSPWGIILRGVSLPGVSYPCESCDFFGSYLKEHSNEIFYLQLFSSFKPGPLTYRLNFRF